LKVEVEEDAQGIPGIRAKECELSSHLEFEMERS
jgi:hypothetical protein